MSMILSRAAGRVHQGQPLTQSSGKTGFRAVGNTFSANVSSLGKAAGYAFRIQTPKRTNNIVKCDNTVTGGIGLANETCTAS